MSTSYTDKELNEMPDERLMRKADQSDEMGCLALNDGDKTDAKRHFAFAKRCREVILSRR